MSYISISEQLPTDEKEYLCITEEGKKVIAKLNKYGIDPKNWEWQTDYFNYPFNAIKKYMVIPEE